jgi:hypothetical protein
MKYSDIRALTRDIRSPCRLDLRRDDLLKSSDFRLIPFVEDPLLCALRLYETCRRQNSHVLAKCRLRNSKLLCNRARAHSVLHQIPVHLGRKVRLWILQPLQNLLPPIIGKRLKNLTYIHGAYLCEVTKHTAKSSHPHDGRPRAAPRTPRSQKGQKRRVSFASVPSMSRDNKMSAVESCCRTLLEVLTVISSLGNMTVHFLDKKPRHDCTKTAFE